MATIRFFVKQMNCFSKEKTEIKKVGGSVEK